MAGASLSATGIKEAIAEFKGIQNRTQHAHPFMQRAALRMHGNAIKHFSEQRGPNGPWGSTKFYDETGGPAVRGGRGGTKILMDTGLLRGSILFEGHDHDARVYTETVYAATHQYGDPSRHIMARPFLWLDEKTKESIKDDFIPWLLGGVVR